jgi:hypothetical protein
MKPQLFAGRIKVSAAAIVEAGPCDSRLDSHVVETIRNIRREFATPRAMFHRQVPRKTANCIISGRFHRCDTNVLPCERRSDSRELAA